MTLNPFKSCTLYALIVASLILLAAACLPIWDNKFNLDSTFWNGFCHLHDDITYDPRHMRDGDGRKPGLFEILRNNAGFLVRLAAIIGGGVLLGQWLFVLAGKDEQSGDDNEYSRFVQKGSGDL